MGYKMYSLEVTKEVMEYYEFQKNFKIDDQEFIVNDMVEKQGKNSLNELGLSGELLSDLQHINIPGLAVSDVKSILEAIKKIRSFISRIIIGG